MDITINLIYHNSIFIIPYNILNNIKILLEKDLIDFNIVSNDEGEDINILSFTILKSEFELIKKFLNDMNDILYTYNVCYEFN